MCVFFLKENLKDSYKELSIPFHQKPPMNGRELKGSGGRVETDGLEVDAAWTKHTYMLSLRA